MTDLPERPLLRVDEVAFYFDVSRQCVYLWVQHRRLDGTRRPGKPLMITRESVLLWEQSMTGETKCSQFSQPHYGEECG